MLELIFALPLFPLLSFLILVLFGNRLKRHHVAALGAWSIALSAVVAIFAALRFFVSPPEGAAFTQTLWRWMALDGWSASITFYLDPLSLVMILVVTVVGFLIHLYAGEFMAGDEGYARFFAYMNLFVAFMLVLVLADDLLLLYLGWEGVGLCSYLLIGFWYRDENNGAAARKAFVVTRLGDVALALGLFLIYHRLGTLDIQEVMQRATERWPVGSGVAEAAAALLLGGARGNSAQLPLQTWLPDAMAGPTPVSALIHAATMVTAGVYLIARTNGLFLLAPDVLSLVARIGAATLLLAGCSALVQRDIKRVLAYSTISQIGYMFLALGVGAWSAAIFHLMTHAFFKALLFLGAGVVTLCLHHEHDIWKMGGLVRGLPVPFLMFLVAGASLAGFPLVTAGFYSKDTLLWAVWASEHGSVWLWGAGVLGAFLTALYIFRLIFLVFLGGQKTPIGRMPGLRIKVSLGVLAVLSVIGGFVELPATLGDVPLFSRLLERTLPAAGLEHRQASEELLLQVLAALASFSGIALAYLWFVRWRRRAEESERIPLLPRWLERFWLAGWGFDHAYHALVVRPLVGLARANRGDVVDTGYRGLAALASALYRLLRSSQTGRLRWYAAALALGAVVVVALVVLPLGVVP